MSDHDCTGCWRYNPATDREECIVCGVVRAPEVVPDGGTVRRCPECGSPQFTIRAPGSRAGQPRTGDADATFRCSCGATFDEPETEPRDDHGGRSPGNKGAAKRLADADPDVLPDGGQLVEDPDAGLDALGTVTCVGCGDELPLSATVRFARVGELESGWLCASCDESLCELRDGRGTVRFPIAGAFDCPECSGGESA